jgi:hypothetical protein
VRAFLEQLAQRLWDKTYRPRPLWRLHIPKPGKPGPDGGRWASRRSAHSAKSLKPSEGVEYVVVTHPFYGVPARGAALARAARRASAALAPRALTAR